MIVYKSEGSGYGGLLSDFPGCTLWAKPWMHCLPILEVVQTSPDAQSRTLVLVDVNTAFLEKVTERVNITIPRYALAAIDKMAKTRGLSRLAYLARSDLMHG